MSFLNVLYEQIVHKKRIGKIKVKVVKERRKSFIMMKLLLKTPTVWNVFWGFFTDIP